MCSAVATKLTAQSNLKGSSSDTVSLSNDPHCYRLSDTVSLEEPFKLD